jgi:periplasmic protein TonB
VQREPQREFPLPLPPTPAAPAPTPVAPAPTRAAPAQVAALPPAPAAPVITADYRSMLSGWLESHKHYPEEARQRGEEGRAVLRFRVSRSGRVLDYAVVSSTGFADLDAAVSEMMRGATLPPFPPSMTEPEIEVSVTIRYGLAR